MKIKFEITAELEANDKPEEFLSTLRNRLNAVIDGVPSVPVSEEDKPAKKTSKKKATKKKAVEVEEEEETEEVEEELEEPAPKKKTTKKKATKKKTTKKKASKKAPVEDVEDGDEVGEMGFTLEQVKGVLRDVWLEHGKPKATAILAEYDVAKSDELDPSDYAEVYTKCQELL
jgi:U3 small nucleolar RNA-associated protein 14